MAFLELPIQQSGSNADGCWALYTTTQFFGPITKPWCTISQLSHVTKNTERKCLSEVPRSSAGRLPTKEVELGAIKKDKYVFATTLSSDYPS